MTTRADYWRHVPNAISAARLLATPVLLGAIVWNRRGLFTWLLLACLLSDIADGLIARAFRLRSELGARLDSVADLIVLILTVAGLCVFEREFLVAHATVFLGLVALYLGEVALALWRYGRISSFHTILTRIAAYVQGAFVMSLLFWGPQPWLFATMAGLSATALVEEVVLIVMLAEWRSDVRGLWWMRSFE